MKMLDADRQWPGPTIMGDGSEAFDFVAVERGLAERCAYDVQIADTDVGTGKRTSLRELAELLLERPAAKSPSITRRAVRPLWFVTGIGCPQASAEPLSTNARSSRRPKAPQSRSGVTHKAESLPVAMLLGLPA